MLPTKLRHLLDLAQAKTDLSGWVLSLLFHLMILLIISLWIYEPEIVTFELDQIEVISSDSLKKSSGSPSGVRTYNEVINKERSSSSQKSKMKLPDLPMRSERALDRTDIDNFEGPVTGIDGEVVEQIEGGASSANVQPDARELGSSSEDIAASTPSLKDTNKPIFGKDNLGVNRGEGGSGKDESPENASISWRGGGARSVLFENKLKLPASLVNKNVNEIVIVRFRVDQAGIVLFPQIIKASAYPDLDRAVLDHTRSMKFNRANVTSEGTLRYVIKS